MTDSVWISDVLADPDLVLLMETDVVAQDANRAIEAINLLKAGKAVPEACVPKRCGQAKPQRGFNARPTCSWQTLTRSCPRKRLTCSDGSMSVRERSIRSTPSSKRTGRRIPGNFFCWIFGNSKSAFAAEESPDARPFAGPNSGRWKMPFVHKDDQLAVSRSALAGPDVWADPTLFKSVFVSGRLGDALGEAGLRKAFRLSRCRIV
jgi:hypothetical protein